MKHPLHAVGLTIMALAVLETGSVRATENFTSDGSVQILWKQVLASPQDDWVNDLLLLRDGTVLASGFVGRDDKNPTTDWRALAVKLTRDGRQIWRHEYGEGGGADAFWAAAEGIDERLHTAGFTRRLGAGGLDAYLAVLDHDGAMIRETTAGGPAYDRVTDIAATADNNFIAVGFTTVEGKGRDVLLEKVDAAGKEIWRRTFGGPRDDDALYIETTSDGGFVIAGGTDEAGDGDVLVARFDTEGREVWRKVIGERGTLDVPHSLCLHSDGRIQITGYTESWGSREHDLLAITLSPDGEIVRQEVFGGPGDDRAMVSGIDNQDRTWITGYSKSAGAGGYDIFIARLDKDGGFEEKFATIGGPGDDNGTVIRPLDDGTLLLGAYSANLGQGGQDAVVMRIAEPQWTVAPRGFEHRKIR